jgi:hypothetical protein
LLLLLVVGPQGAAPFIVRVAAGAGATILAAGWAWRIVRSGRLGVPTLTNAS